jgi:hypothetical protein
MPSFFWLESSSMNLDLPRRHARGYSNIQILALCLFVFVAIEEITVELLLPKLISFLQSLEVL